MFFVVSLDPPIKQGQTRYHFLVLLFGQEEETSIELPFSEYVLFVFIMHKEMAVHYAKQCCNLVLAS